MQHLIDKEGGILYIPEFNLYAVLIDTIIYADLGDALKCADHNMCMDI